MHINNKMIPHYLIAQKIRSYIAMKTKLNVAVPRQKEACWKGLEEMASRAGGVKRLVEVERVLRRFK